MASTGSLAAHPSTAAALALLTLAACMLTPHVAASSTRAADSAAIAGVYGKIQGQGVSAAVTTDLAKHQNTQIALLAPAGWAGLTWLAVSFFGVYMLARLATLGWRVRGARWMTVGA